jgi:hypothetical protein
VCAGAVGVGADVGALIGRGAAVTACDGEDEDRDDDRDDACETGDDVTIPPEEGPLLECVVDPELLDEPPPYELPPEAGDFPP